MNTNCHDHAPDASYDVAVIGGGAAGLSAALVLGRARRHVIVIDAGSPRNKPAAHMHGFLSRDGMPPAELLAAGRDEIAHYGVEIAHDSVVEVLDTADLEVRLGSGRRIRARRLLLATGITDEIPDIPGVRERWGRDLLHCPYCHGWEVRDQPLGVLGTLPGSVDHALLVRQWSNDVVFFANTYELTDLEHHQLTARGIQIETGAVTRLIVEHDQMTGVELDDGRIVARSAVFVRPGNTPHHDGLSTALDLATNPTGFVTVDPTGRTSNQRVWAAGNVVDPRAQVITSAGHGSAAAIAINADLVADDVAHAMRTERHPAISA